MHDGASAVRRARSPASERIDFRSHVNEPAVTVLWIVGAGGLIHAGRLDIVLKANCREALGRQTGDVVRFSVEAPGAVTAEPGLVDLGVEVDILVGEGVAGADSQVDGNAVVRPVGSRVERAVDLQGRGTVVNAAAILLIRA